MALISCEECGKEMSDMAVSCPHCGFARMAVIQQGQRAEQGQRQAQGCIFLIIVGILAFFIVYVIDQTYSAKPGLLG